MNREQLKVAIQLVQKLTQATADHVMAVNSNTRKSPAICADREAKAGIAILKALIGREPTDQELEEALNW